MAPRSSEGIPSQGQEFHHLHIVWKFVAKQPRWLIASWVSLFAISTLALVLILLVPLSTSPDSPMCTQSAVMNA